MTKKELKKPDPSVKAKQMITAETWTRFGLPCPQIEVRVCEDRKWRVDFFWPCRCPQGCSDRAQPALAVEVHGGTWSGGGHSRGARQASDFAKGHRATLRGWHRLEFTPRQVTSGYGPAVVAAWLRGDARPELPPDPEDRRKGRAHTVNLNSRANFALFRKNAKVFRNNAKT